MASGNIKNFELKLGRTGLVIIIVGMAALLCCSFLFGVSVGKNIDTYPGKIAALPQKLLAFVWRPAKIRAAQTAAQNKAAQDQAQKPEEMDLTFYNTLTGKKGAVKEQPIPDKKPVAEAPAAQQLLPQPGNDVDAVSIAPAVEAKKPSAATKKTAGDQIEAKIKEVEEAAAVPSGKFSVQVASLRDKTKAAQLSKKISTLGYTPRIAENNISGKGKWFRVVVDGFGSKVDAETAVEKICNKTGVRGVVKRIDAQVKSN
jgi:cell division septation protein DedD